MPTFKFNFSSNPIELLKYILDAQARGAKIVVREPSGAESDLKIVACPDVPTNHKSSVHYREEKLG